MATVSNEDLGPPYPDLLDGQRLSDEQKYNILTKQWTGVHTFKFPSRFIGSSKRKLKSHWFVQNTWLRYSKSKDSVYCGPCRFFGPQSSESREKAFGTTTITDWSNLQKLISRHEATQSHQSSLLSAESFLKVIDGESKDIYTELDDRRKSISHT